MAYSGHKNTAEGVPLRLFTIAIIPHFFALGLRKYGKDYYFPGLYTSVPQNVPDQPPSRKGQCRKIVIINAKGRAQFVNSCVRPFYDYIFYQLLLKEVSISYILKFEIRYFILGLVSLYE